MRRASSDKVALLALVLGLAVLLFPIKYAGMRVGDISLCLLACLFVFSRPKIKAGLVHVSSSLLFLSFISIFYNGELFFVVSRWIVFGYVFYEISRRNRLPRNTIYWYILTSLLLVEFFVAVLQKYLGFFFFDDQGSIHFGSIFRASGTFGNSMFLGVFGALMGVVLFWTANRRSLRWFVFFLSLAVVILSGTRSSIAVLMLGVVSGYLIRWRHTLRLAACIALLLPVVIGYLNFHEPNLSVYTYDFCFKMNEGGYIDKSLGMRLEKLNFAVYSVLTSNLFGNGSGNCIGGGADMAMSRLVNDFGLPGFVLYLVVSLFSLKQIGSPATPLYIAFIIQSLTFDVLHGFVSLAVGLIGFGVLASRYTSNRMRKGFGF